MSTIKTKDGTTTRTGDRVSPSCSVTAGNLSSKIVKGSVYKVYQGAPHGLATTHKDKLNEDLLTFFKN